MKLFLTSAAGLAFGLAFASAASAACLSGNCPPVAGTALTYTNPPTSTLPQPRNWQSMIQFNAGWAAETNGLASGIGDNVEALSAITEQYTVNSLGSVMVDPNCGPQCGEQTLTSDWDLMQTVDNPSRNPRFPRRWRRCPKVLLRSKSPSLKLPCKWIS